ncbi:hypothetical protein GJ496_003438, partial [Pomphorhynchus laevis]
MVIIEDNTGEKSLDVKTAADNLQVAQSIVFDNEANRVSHHTEMYTLQNVVLRRGLPFRLKIKLNYPYDEKKHKIELIFSTGGVDSKVSAGTCIRVGVGEIDKLSKWSAKVAKSGEDAKSDILDVDVSTSTNALAGQYRIDLEIKTVALPDSTFKYYKSRLHFFLIFNPWHKEDDCYMEKIDDINEYVLEDDGVIFLGTKHLVIPRHWHYGQFDRSIIEYAFWLLAKCGLPAEEHGNPVLVSRTLAAMINAGNRGMVNEYDDSRTFVLPQNWPGSVSIITSFSNQKAKPIKFGECWTFAAVYCSLARSIGIPCRVISGYNIMHNCDSKKRVNIHWSKSKVPLNALNTDNIWVRHVWNEVWFKRSISNPDINGWQAIDCTTNIGSESLYKVGPSPVKAIQKGKCNEMYDTPFMHSSTNGDIVHWTVDALNNMIPF